MAKQLGAETYLECSAFTSEKSIHSVFRTAALACMNKLQAANKPSPVRRLSKRLLHLPSKTELLSSTFSKDKSKSCSIMWILLRSYWGKKKKEGEQGRGNWCQGVQGKESNDHLSLLRSILPKTILWATSAASTPSLFNSDSSIMTRHQHTVQGAELKNVWCWKCFWSFKYTCRKESKQALWCLLDSSHIATQLV